MTFNEWVVDKGSLFGEINKIKEIDFITEYGASKLDSYFKMYHGNKPIPNYLINLSLLDLANSIVIDYNNSWLMKYKLYMLDLDPMVLSSDKVTESISDTTSKKSSNNSLEKVSAFNDSELSTNNGNENTSNDDVTKVYDKKTEIIHTNLDSLLVQRNLFEDSFIEKVCKDICKYTSLQIY